jgi:selenoprotein W-related protein
MAPKRVKVSVTFCSECGYEPQTLELVKGLLYAVADRISSIELIPWHDGTFEVSVGGTLVHSMAREGGFPMTETIIQAVKEQSGAADPTAPDHGFT